MRWGKGSRGSSTASRFCKLRGAKPAIRRWTQGIQLSKVRNRIDEFYKKLLCEELMGVKEKLARVAFLLTVIACGWIGFTLQSNRHNEGAGTSPTSRRPAGRLPGVQANKYFVKKRHP